jgi:hypothetical protein
MAGYASYYAILVPTSDSDLDRGKFTARETGGDLEYVFFGNPTLRACEPTGFQPIFLNVYVSVLRCGDILGQAY